MSKVDPTIREIVREETAARFSRRYQTRVPLGTSDGTKGRCHIDDQMLPLRAHLDDQQFDREDEFVFINLIEEARYSLTCEILSPEEMLIRLEEEEVEEEEVFAKLDLEPEVTASSHESNDSEEEQDETEACFQYAAVIHDAC